VTLWRNKRGGRAALCGWLAGLMGLVMAGMAPDAVAAAAAPGTPPAVALKPPAVAARAAILVAARSGQVLAQYNAHRKLPMASVTKLMTLVLAFRAVDRGRVKLSDWVPVTHEAYKTEGSQIWLEPGELLTLRQMLTAIAVGSANDASVAVAQFLAGSTDAFVAEMNREADRLGMSDTHFDNPHGLPSLNHHSSAADLARLAEAAVRLPGLLKLTSQWQDRTIRNGKGGKLWLVNQNRLLRTYPGTDGLKTGYTSAAGFCLVATTLRSHTRLIAVILGAPSSSARFKDATSWLSWGFSHFRTVEAMTRGREFGVVRVHRGRLSRVRVVASRGVWATVPLGSKDPTITSRIAASVEAPVRADQTLGEAVVKWPDGRVDRVKLVAGRAVPAVGVPELFWRFFRSLVAAGVA
jgi:D-alanyl-D-alanine carboxypeptidase (penicillin-binding protein 5/6)